MTPMDTERHAKLNNFLKKIGLEAAIILPLAGDASFRHYNRIIDGEKSFILMDAPPPQENVKPFIAIAKHLKCSGFSAPIIYEKHIDDGFLLLEDLGDSTFNEVLKFNPAIEKALYKNAIDCLVELHCKPLIKTLRIEKDTSYNIQYYDVNVMFEEFFLFVDWYLPEVSPNINLINKPHLKNLFGDLFGDWTPLLDTFVLRDFHSENLMHLEDRDGHTQVGLLDFQDAMIGHKAYDLVSLLKDARRDVPTNLEEAMITRFLKGHADICQPLDKDEFLRVYHLLGAGRNAKIIGIFTRLWKRDNKPQFLKLIPRVMAHLEKNLEHPALAPLKIWFEEVLPPIRRVAPNADT
ncbi:MAG: aminoglycoside phosphotransferase family protein [Sphingomonadales bacterium]|jgi:aminoglycoside/choline kinase family phosphotransferase